MTMTPDMTLCSVAHKDDTFPPGGKMAGENVMESHHNSTAVHCHLGNCLDVISLFSLSLGE